MYEPEGKGDTKKARSSPSTQSKLMKSHKLSACTGLHQVLCMRSSFQVSVYMEFMSV